MKTVLIMTIEHRKPIPDLTDIAAGRVYTLDGVTDVTAAIQDERTGWPPGLLQDDDRKLSKALADAPHARRIAEEQAEKIAQAKADNDANFPSGRQWHKAAPGKESFWSWLWRTQS